MSSKYCPQHLMDMREWKNTRTLSEALEIKEYIEVREAYEYAQMKDAEKEIKK